ncbi:MAG: hypothetical protein R2713_12380 [Ilumatobacteraceae bacterium]
MRNWRKTMLKPLTPQHLDRLTRLTGRVEALWQLVVPTLEAAERGLRRPIEVWGCAEKCRRRSRAGTTAISTRC